jgi:N6-L-threonylcarbamoyladenine synthase
MKAGERILALESSCDETAAAVLESPGRVLSSVVASQIGAHRPYGGVVPELAARAHLEALPVVLEEAIRTSGLGWSDVTAIAYTRGPGLSSSLLAGAGAARALAQRLQLPLLPVHHLEGHILSMFLSDDAPAPSPDAVCPALVLLVTGGHTALLRMDAPGVYVLLGRSIDDAAGEALDKGARLLGLPYPGGPEIEKLAMEGCSGSTFTAGLPDSDEARKRGGAFPFSFSGLKTALRYHLDKHPDDRPADVAHAYQTAVMRSLVRRVEQALETHGDFRSLACVGGVAKNRLLSEGLERAAAKASVPLIRVAAKYCTDNAAMIGIVPFLRMIPPAEQALSVDPNLAMDGLKLR